MTKLRKCILGVFAIAILGAGIAATTPHHWGQGIGAAAASVATAAGIAAAKESPTPVCGIDGFVCP